MVITVYVKMSISGWQSLSLDAVKMFFFFYSQKIGGHQLNKKNNNVVEKITLVLMTAVIY